MIGGAIYDDNNKMNYKNSMKFHEISNPDPISPFILM